MSSTIWCPVIQFVITILVVLSCIVFLTIATFENLRYGPKTVPLTLHLSSFIFNKLRLNPSQKLMVTWMSNFVILNHTPHLNVTIRPFDTFITYMGIPISCGVMNETIHIGPKQERTFQIKHNPIGCEWEGVMQGPIAANFKADLEHKKVMMGLRMRVRAYYKHRSWGWDVWINPYCQDLIIKLDDAQGKGRFKGNGTTPCRVPSPSWYI